MKEKVEPVVIQIQPPKKDKNGIRTTKEHYKQDGHDWFNKYIKYITRDSACVKVDLDSSQLLELDQLKLNNGKEYWEEIANYSANPTTFFSGLYMDGVPIPEDKLANDVINEFNWKHNNQDKFFWNGVVSFDTAFFEKNNIFTPKDLNFVVNKYLTQMAEQNGIAVKDNNLALGFALHNNTKNIHIHFFYYEREPKEAIYLLDANGNRIKDKKTGKSKFKTSYHQIAPLKMETINNAKQRIAEGLDLETSSLRREAINKQNLFKSHSGELFTIDKIKSIYNSLLEPNKTVAEQYEALVKELRTYSKNGKTKLSYGSKNIPETMRSKINIFAFELLNNADYLMINKELKKNKKDFDAYNKEYVSAKFNALLPYFLNEYVEEKRNREYQTEYSKAHKDGISKEKFDVSWQKEHPYWISNEDTTSILNGPASLDPEKRAIRDKYGKLTFDSRQLKISDNPRARFTTSFNLNDPIEYLKAIKLNMLNDPYFSTRTDTNGNGIKKTMYDGILPEIGRKIVAAANDSIKEQIHQEKLLKKFQTQQRSLKKRREYEQKELEYRMKQAEFEKQRRNNKIRSIKYETQRVINNAAYKAKRTYEEIQYEIRSKEQKQKWLDEQATAWQEYLKTH